MKIKQIQVPDIVVGWLGKEGQSKYTNLNTVFHAFCFSVNFQTHQQSWAGVVGDGDNGSYEWFIHAPDGREVSQCGYGDPLIALRDLLNKIEPPIDQVKPDPDVKVPAYQRLTEGWDPDELKGGK